MTVDVGTRIAQIAAELRAIAANGLHYLVSDYDRARYERTRELAAELTALVDTRPAAEIARAFRGDLGLRTPFVGVDAAMFDGDGRVLLVQRRDSGRWCLPGGAAEVGESPSTAVEREAREETGLTVRATRLLAVFDNHTFGVRSAIGHIYHVVFRCEVLGGALAATNETLAARWYTESEAAGLTLSQSHVYKVPAAFEAYKFPDRPAAFH